MTGDDEEPVAESMLTNNTDPQVDNREDQVGEYFRLAIAGKCSKNPSSQIG